MFGRTTWRFSVQKRASGVQRISLGFGKRLRIGLYRLVVTLVTLLQVVLRRLVRGPRHQRWDFRYELAATLLRNMSQGAAELPVHELRKYALARPVPSFLRGSLRHEIGNFSGLYAETFTPQAVRGARTLLYFHGGGYVLCSPATHRDLVSRLAFVAAARTIAIDYRKAPEYPYPAGIDDCEQAYRALLAQGIPPEQIILAGDSAGGGLALAVLLRARDAALPLPGCAILLSPWCDLTQSGESIRINAAYDYLTPQNLVVGVGHYLQGQDPQHPHVTHVRADLRGLPPLMVVTGDAELFYSENMELVTRARAHGVSVTHLVEPGRVHVSALLSALAPSAASTFAHVEAFVARESGLARTARIANAS
jgi:acetyl esterase/lipase